MSPARRLPLGALRIFEAAARLESFKDAAAELGVSATTVSNQIRALERSWGCRLFERRTRQVVLTDTGLSLSRVIRQSFDAIAREIDMHVAGSRLAVSLAVGPVFGAQWMAPRLSAFRRALPRIDLSLLHHARITGPATMPTPIAVDWGTGDWPGLEAEFLFRVRYAPVLSPALAQEAGPLAAPGDLARMPVLYQHDRSEWAAWLDLAGAPALRFAAETIIDDTNIVIQAAIAGQGVALGTFPFVQADIDAGRLVKPFAQELAPLRSYYLLVRPGARRRPEVAAVCDWLAREAALHRQGDDTGREARA